MKKMLLPLFLALSAPAVADPGHEHPMPTMPKEFDALKALVGTWEGTGKMGGKDEPLTVIYELTAGGTAIAEKLMPGTPHEMVTIYYKDGNSLALTHYCAMGNHPEMKLIKADGNTLVFEMKGTAGLGSAKEPHMHALKLTIGADHDTLTQEWTHYADGKKGPVGVFNLKRKKA